MVIYNFQLLPTSSLLAGVRLSFSSKLLKLAAMGQDRRVSGFLRETLKTFTMRRDAERAVLLVWTLLGCSLAVTVFWMLYTQASLFEESAFNLRCINRAQVNFPEPAVC